jgi:hypothetical protein
MTDLTLKRDGAVLALLALMIVLLVAGLAGAYHVFGYALVLFLGMLMALGFVRRGDPVTWVPPLLASGTLLAAFAGMFAYETRPVASASDTWLGFQPGTFFLIYGVWIPAFFTMGVSFALVFHRLDRTNAPSSEREGSRR